MQNATQAIDRYAWLYTDLPVPPSAFDHFILVDGGLNGIKVEPDGSATVDIHGSEDGLDWLHDGQAIPTDHPQLGPVHTGFLSGALIIKAQVDAFVGDRHVTYRGHSYGAGRAAILAGLRITEGKPVAGIMLFGEPRAGGPKLSQTCAGVPVESYRNAMPNGGPFDHDLVDDVPFTLPTAPYQPLRTRTDVYHHPRADDIWGFFAWHHLGHYARALGCGTPQALSLPV